ncbi:MAG: GAF domain-containing protein [Pseudomonadota bacterium]
MTVARDRIAAAADVDRLVVALRECGRSVTGADGVTVVRREGNEVVYVTEDAISPLWAGQRFHLRLCVSGIAITTRAPVVIADISKDSRVPLNAYLSTFVKSMVMVPIGHGDPQMAMGAYWRTAEPIAAIAIERLSELATAAADALARIEGAPEPGRQVA